ncbi:DNA-binding protein [Orrella sp. NBD-18]|uniref:DNA-binding protein n=1 Tax=Sheuella amnicola TaxID=2707330 RepID=A0A6B2QYC5_9BURK|nr:OB-fold domain-containing protein [Sheuella amnicola]NDY83021.1 DNA-binding protein [Sheuella amnicola]HBI83622.1 DNA-binding protein [Alcaligenaceae bacterium]
MTHSNAHISLAQPYLDGVTKHQIQYQICGVCHHAQTLARDACQHCGAEQLSWKVSSGFGTVYSATIVGRAPSDVFRPLAPYTLVIVTLAEGSRVMGHAEPGVKIGDRVKANFFEHQGQMLIRFEPCVD